jgi:ABC-type phosphate/phosphonate transport system substrate-binding protein
MKIGVPEILLVGRAAAYTAASVLAAGALAACVASQPAVPPSASLQRADVEVVVAPESSVGGQGPEIPIVSEELVEQPQPEVIPVTNPDYEPNYDADYNSGDVAWIQQRLQDLGYYQGDIDGEVGKATREAIKQYQQDQDVESDGRPTAELREFMWRNGG